MKLNFSKYQATGNDFVLINGLSSVVKLEPAAIQKICDRHFGIGADGLIIAAPSEKGDIFMDYYNSDGSIAEMCGNGVRALAAFAGHQKSEIKVETRAGLKTVKINGNLLTVDMGKASFGKWNYPLTVNNHTITIYEASMGNPHCIIFTDNAETAPVEELGPVIENHPIFKNRTNVEWVEVKDKNNMAIKVWERGVGYTLACGTGVCASFAVANRLNLVEKQANISLPGGQLQVELADENLLLTGEAKKVFEGIVTI